MNKTILSNNAPPPVGHYPHARRVADLLFLSGVGPRQAGSHSIPGVELDRDGKICSYDIECQCHAVFKNVRNILESSGAKWTDLVDVTVYLTNIKDDFKIYNRVYSQYFSDSNPCRTTVEVTALPTPIAIELKCIAYLGS